MAVRLSGMRAPSRLAKLHAIRDGKQPLTKRPPDRLAPDRALTSTVYTR